MNILSIFSNQLKELMEDNEIKTVELANELGLARTAIGKYLRAEQLPNVEILIKIADYFNCSTNSLFELKEHNNTNNFIKCSQPFKERFPQILEKLGVTKYRLEHDAHLTQSAIYSWQSGRTEPSVESLYKIAKTYNISLDYLLGREK